jgi:hypothetical protein
LSLVCLILSSIKLAFRGAAGFGTTMYLHRIDNIALSRYFMPLQSIALSLREKVWIPCCER